MVKVTHSLADATVRLSRRIAERLGKPQSQVVVAHFAAATDRLSEVERLRMLKVIESIREAPPTRSPKETDAELREIRASRRTGWPRKTDPGRVGPKNKRSHSSRQPSSER